MSFCITITDRTSSGIYDYEEVLKWIEQYCKSYTGVLSKAIYKTDHYIPDYHEILYHFDDESDATLFGLRWS